MKKVRYLVYGLFGGFVVLCPLVFDCFSALCRFRAAFVCLYALGFIFLLKALLAPGRRLRIALPDVLLALYLSWGACNLLFVKAGGTDALPIFEWISLLLGYLLARSVPERAVPLVLGAIVCSGCVQAAAGFLQWLDVLPSNRNLFPVTGSFMNPGPYGGYLAVCWVVGAGWRSGRYAGDAGRRLPDGRLPCWSSAVCWFCPIRVPPGLPCCWRWPGCFAGPPGFDGRGFPSD